MLKYIALIVASLAVLSYATLPLTTDATPNDSDPMPFRVYFPLVFLNADERSPLPTATPTFELLPTLTPSPTPTSEPTPSPTSSPTPTPSPTSTPSAVATFGPNVKVNTVGHRAGLPSVAVDPAGNAYVVWVDEHNGYTEVYFSRRSQSTGSWSAPLKIDDASSGTFMTEPIITVDCSGNAFAAWRDYRDGVSNIYATRYNATTHIWSTNVKVNDGGHPPNPDKPPYSDLVDVKADCAGNAYAIWRDNREGSLYIYMSRYDVAKLTWEQNVRVNPDDSLDRGAVRIAVDDSGNLYVVYVVFAYEVRFREYAATLKNWRPEVTLSATNYVPEGQRWYPAIAVDPFSNVHVVWHDPISGNMDILYAFRSGATGLWTPYIKINDDGGTTNQGDPRIGVDAAGNAYALWVDWRNENDTVWNTDIYFAVRDCVTGVWSPNRRVNDDATDRGQYDPDIAVASNGAAYAVWQDGRNDPNYDQLFDVYFAYKFP